MPHSKTKKIHGQKYQQAPIYVVSGGKGVMGHTILETMLIQYPDNKIPIIMESEVRTAERIEECTNRVVETKGAVVLNMVNHKMRRFIPEACDLKNIPHFDLVGGLADYLDQTLDIRPVEQPGLYRLRNIEYFRRVRAIEFTMAHDDGQNASKIENADVVLAGVSRAGKTPLSIYLAMFGWKVANVPIVPGIPPPDSLFNVLKFRNFYTILIFMYLLFHDIWKMLILKHLKFHVVIGKLVNIAFPLRSLRFYRLTTEDTEESTKHAKM